MSESVPDPKSGRAAPEGVSASPFPRVVVDKQSVDFDHLATFSFSFDTPTRKGVHCVVQFATHCFSDKHDPARHPENVVIVDERGVHRCFDQDRYDLSKGLAALIRALPGNRVYQTPESNFAIVTTASGREYRVYFNVRRLEKRKLRLYVESAYAPDAEQFKVLPVTAYQRVRFVILVDRLLANQPLAFHGR